MNHSTQDQETLHLSQSIALMRSLNQHLTQTRVYYEYEHATDETIDEALTQLDLAISQLDKIRDGHK